MLFWLKGIQMAAVGFANKNNSLSVSKQVTCQVSAVSIDKGKYEIM